MGFPDKEPFFSVVIPMYNSELTIKSALDSVIKQNFEGLIEIIIVNDGSRDNSYKIIEDYIPGLPKNRKVILLNKKNGGVSSARNLGIKTATGEWVAFLDSDDVWFIDKLNLQYKIIKENHDIKFIGTNRNGEQYSFFDKAKKNLYSLNEKEIIAKWYPHTSTALVRKDILLEAGLYDEERSHAEDGDLWLKIAKHCDLWVLNQDMVYTGNGKRTFGESGLSADLSKMYRGEILAIKGAKERKQINYFYYSIFYFWLTVKYLRRIFIVRFVK